MTVYPKVSGLSR